jgi:hypothetical protein
MGKRGLARTVLASAAILALALALTVAGCSGVPKGTAPDVPGEGAGSTATSATSPGAGSAGSGQQGSGQPSIGGPGASPISGTRPITSKHGRVSTGPFVTADSVPFPVAVGNTWVYRTTAGGAAGRTTNTIVSTESGQAGYLVTMSSTTDVAGTATVAQPVYVFYPDGTIGYPVPPVNGVSVAGAVRWPDVADLASGRAYHSVLRLPAGQGENVTVQGAGTASVSVPAGTYQASVVHMTIGTKVGIVEVTTWIAQGIGPVKTTALIRSAGTAELLTSSELLSFTKAAVAVMGS